MTRATDSVQDLLTCALREGKRRIVTLAALFSVVAIVALIVGLRWPRKYSATATLLVEPRSTIGPATEGDGPPRWAVVNQIMISKRVLREVMVVGGWGEPPDPRAEERLLNTIRARISIASPAANTTGAALVRITYTDPEPERTLKIANKLTEIYIRESVVPEENARRETFQFIDDEVKEYAKKLAEVHERVLAYYRTHGAALTRPISASPPVAPPRGSKISPEELAALRAEEATLIAEVGRKREPVAPELVQAERRYRERAVQLQAELERLLATYTNEHPDVKRVRGELAQATANAEQARVEREAAEATELAAPLDDARLAARTRLEIVQKRIASATGERIRTPSEVPPVAIGPDISQQQDPDMRVIREDATMSELLRGYEATRDIYRDLLKRREQARVALGLAEQRGLQLQIQEPPELPATPSGVRLLYILLAGMVLAAALPLGLVVAIVKLDGRVRTLAQAQASSKLPVLVRIPYVPEPDEQRRQRLRFVVAQGLVALVFILYAAVFYFRAKA